MDVGSQMQQVLLDRAGAYLALTWVVVAVFVGLMASEWKKRRFWTWLVLSLLTGPIAWYLLFVRLGIAIPAELRVECRHCHRITRSDQKTCLFCKKLLVDEQTDRATDVGRQAAAVWVMAKGLAGRTGKVAGKVVQQRKQASRGSPDAPAPPPR